MDPILPDDTCNWPGPWLFAQYRYGFSNVVTDRDGRYITSNIPAECGPLLAAGPTLLTALEQIATQTAPGSPAHETAIGALESFREREGMTLVDWNPEKPAPRLRIVGEAR